MRVSPGRALRTDITARQDGETTTPTALAAVSFDVDGTLYSDRFLKAQVALEAIRQGLVRPLRDLHRFSRRAVAARAAGRLDPAWESDVPRPARGGGSPAAPGHPARRGPRAGAADLLTRLRPRTLIAVSDFDAEAKLEALGLRHHFDHTYAAERYGALKPDPAVFRAALADLGIAPSTLLHVGDRPDTDGLAARAAGARALILGTDFASFRGLGDLLAP